jgi:hypothetical protein
MIRGKKADQLSEISACLFRISNGRKITLLFPIEVAYPFLIPSSLGMTQFSVKGSYAQIALRLLLQIFN